MKQLVVRQADGAPRLVNLPAPALGAGGARVGTRASVVSIGTEKTGVDFGRKSLVAKAASRPEQVKQVIGMAARDGVGKTVERVRAKLDSEWAPGYSCAGVVLATGDGTSDLEVGQRVACAGAGFAVHAEKLVVPRNLMAVIPDRVSFEEAAFTTLGAIALQGVRQADVRLGEVVAVIGLGLLGQLTVQLLAASGARPVAIDLDPARVALARDLGAAGLLRSEDVEGAITQLTNGAGADATIIAAATSSTDPIQLAGRIARERSRVVIVGDVPIEVPRSPYYEKELDVRMSRSYGPGRYDPSYEEKGHDYPIGYVRWTERRNMEEFLRLLATGAVRIGPLITHRFDFADAEDAYARVMSGDVEPAPLGVVFMFAGEPSEEDSRRIELPGGSAPVDGKVGVSLLGTGSFATDTLIPALAAVDVDFRGVASARGLSARAAGERHAFGYVAAGLEELVADGDTDLVVIATPHSDHAGQTTVALEAGKAAFVEKPLAISRAGLERVLAAAETGPPLMVGFNRRFAPATEFVKSRLDHAPGARVVNVRANAGPIPPEHWIHDPEVGGGRLIGEVCHFIDLSCYLVGAGPSEVDAIAIGGPDPDASLQDNLVVTLRFDDGSVASIVYTSKGDTRPGKERIEVFAGGLTCVIDDFTRAEVWKGGKRERWKGKQDKGHGEEMRRFVEALRKGDPSPILLTELAASSWATLDAAEVLKIIPVADDAAARSP